MTTEQTERKRTFDCPTCKEPFSMAIPPRYHADEFCPDCDFPMFWAPDVEKAILEPESTTKTGEIGSRPSTTDAPTEPCPVCEHGNAAEAVYCNACGTALAAVTDAGTGDEFASEVSWWDGTWGRLTTVALIIALVAAIAWGIMQIVD